jgi:phage-related protein
MPEAAVRPVEWIGSSYKDFIAFPDDVQDHIGYALYVAQIGDKHEDAKPLKGFGGAGVLEVVSDYASDTFRAVYTVKFETAIYVLHAFQKKSKSGRRTPAVDMDLIARRMKTAEADDLAHAEERSDDRRFQYPARHPEHLRRSRLC